LTRQPTVEKTDYGFTIPLDATALFNSLSLWHVKETHAAEKHGSTAESHRAQ